MLAEPDQTSSISRNLMDQRVSVFVVDDDQAVRDSVRWLIETNGRQAKTFASAREFLDQYDGMQPGCLVLDIRMPGMTGLELQDHLNEARIDLPTIFVTGHADVPMAIRAVKSGAFDFLEKPFDDQLLMSRIEQAIELDEQRRSAPDALFDIHRRVNRLTRREKQVMQGVSIGQSNKEIAEDLDLSPKTIEVYRARVMQKMQAENLASLVRMLVHIGM